ncbi:NADH-cytochrome b5 reductase [Allomyces arbusculus]|nr:NADH-cytochrome b5 reductase [Allomyces arbusculus]
MTDPLVAKEYQAATRARARVARCGTVAYWLGVFLLVAFTVGMLIVLQILVLKGKVYPSQTSNIGWAIHAWPGLVYFIIGFFQFSDRFRHAYPRVHRLMGWTYLTLTAVTIIGMIMILIGGSHAGESAVLFAITGGVLWVSLLVLATKAIMRGDVKLHRRYHLAAFIVSFSIVPMRIGVVILAGITGLTTDEVLKTVLWWGLTWFFIGGELYLFFERKTTPAAAVMLPTASNSAPGDVSVLPIKVNGSNTLAPWIPVVLVEGEYLNARTVRAVFAAANDAAAAHIPHLVVPGQHIALAHKSGKREVTRSYSPTTSPYQAHRGQIELVVRLVPGGAMSTALTGAIDALADPTNASNQAMWSLSVSASDVPYTPGMQSPLILVAAGTGLAPLWNLACAAVAARTDRVHLVVFHRTNDDVFFADRFEQLRASSEGTFTYSIVLTKEGEKSVDLRTPGTLAGFLTEAMDAAKVGCDVALAAPAGPLVVGSGPPEFAKLLLRVVVREVKLKPDQVFAFGVSDR